MFGKLRNGADDGTSDRAGYVEGAILDRLKEDPADTRVSLRQFLRLYFKGFAPFSEPPTSAMDLDSNYQSFHSIKIFVTFPNRDINIFYPLVIHQPVLKLLFSSGTTYAIQNLAAFLDDYQKATNSWIDADDILEATVTHFFSEQFDRFSTNLIVNCEME